MSRPSKPWLDKDKKRYFCTIRGTRHNLGPDQAEALKTFYALMAGRPHPGARLVAGEAPDLKRVISEYLAWLPLTTKASTVRMATVYLKPFRAALGRRKVNAITPLDIKQTVEGHTAWKAGGQRFAYVRISAVFNWAVKEHPEWGIRNPAKKVRWPAQRTRSISAVPTPEQYEQILDEAKPYFRDVLVTMFESGARPGEIVRVEAKDYHREAKVFVLEEHKTDGKTGKRVIHLSSKVIEIVERLIQLYPTGTLYRSKYKRPYRSGHRISTMFRTLCRRLGLPDTLVPHGLRHAFATDLLSAGEADVVVAALLGHKGTKVLTENYSHVDQRSDVLRAALGRHRGSGPEKPSQVSLVDVVELAMPSDPEDF